MRYDIIWEPDATRDFDAAWVVADSPLRGEIKRAIAELHSALRHGPMEIGESRGVVDERVAVSSPLTVYYRVDQRQQFVALYAVVVYKAN